MDIKAIFMLFSFLALSNLSFAGQKSQDYLSATRYNIAGQVTGTISPDPDGLSGPLNRLATRTIYQNGLVEKVENGYLKQWQDETIKPENWSHFIVITTIEYKYNDYQQQVAVRVIGEKNTTKQFTQYSYYDGGEIQCVAKRMNLEMPNYNRNACELENEGEYGKDRITKYEYNHSGNIIKEWRAFNTPLKQVYKEVEYESLFMRPKAYIDANFNKTELEYNDQGLLKRRIYPSKTSVGEASSYDNDSCTDCNEYRYDENGNMIWEKKRNGKVFTYQYNNLNQMIKKNIPGTTSKDIYYDYDNRGLTLYSRFGSHTGQGIINEFDGFGNLAKTTNTLGGRNRALKHVYDKNNNRTKLTHADGKYIDYSFDELDRAYRIRLNGTTQLWNQFHSNGKREYIRRNFNKDGATTKYGFDPAQRLASLNQNFKSTANDVTYGYTYNPAQQITELTISNPTFHYMGNDNITGSYTPNGLNQYTKIDGKSVSHDDNGNLTGYNGTTYKYDHENRLISTSGSVSSNFEYDPLGRLFKVTIGNKATEFLYDGDALVAEYEGTTLKKRYIHGDQVDEPLVEYNGAGTSSRRFLHADHRGSIVAVSNQAGNMLNSLSYDTFGIPGAENVGRFGYTGQIWFPELGLYHYKARMYNPYIGRFMQTDPVGYEDQMNLYAYTHNDPINYTDPTGEVAKGVIIVAAAACAKSPACRKAVAKGAKKVGEGAKKIKKKYFSRKQREKKHEEADKKCEYCGKETQMDEPFQPDSAEGDHIEPVSQGGETTDENHASSCRECNQSKSDEELGTEWEPPNPNERIQEIIENKQNGS